MSRLYASISSDASKTEATRRGHNSITTHTRGWDLGVEVEARLNDRGQEYFAIYATGGSNGGGGLQMIGYLTQEGDSRVFSPSWTGLEVDRGEYRVPAVRLGATE